MSYSIKYIKKTLTLQTTSTDCGCACLSSVFNYYQLPQPYHEIRYLTGQSSEGTTMLGLYQAAAKLGFKAEAVEVAGTFSELPYPLIIHTSTPLGEQHYVVLYGKESSKNVTSYIIGDPAKGVLIISEAELNECWRSRTALILSPADTLCVKRANSGINSLRAVLIPHTGTLLLLLAYAMMAAALGLSVPIYIKRIIDHQAYAPGVEEIYTGTFLLGSILLARSCLNYIREHISLLFYNQLSTHLSTLFANHVYSVQHSSHPVAGETVASGQQIENIKKSLLTIANNGFNDCFIFILALSAITYYSMSAFVIFLVGVPIFMWMAAYFKQPLKIRQDRLYTGYSRLESLLIEHSSHLPAIKQGGVSQQFKKHFLDNYAQHTVCLTKHGKFLNRLNWIADLLTILVLVFVLLFVSISLANKEISGGDAVAVLFLSTILIPIISRLNRLYYTIWETSNSLERLEVQAAYEIKQPVSNKAVEKISLDKISYSHPGCLPVLTDVSLELRKGELVLLKGGSGAGKSTLLKLIHGCIVPDNGRIAYNNLCFESIGYPGQVSLMPQLISIFDDTLIANICMRKNDDAAAFQAFCEEFGFDEAFGRYNIPQTVNKRQISGGQKQLIGFARALFDNPSVLLLDEPFTGMDDYLQCFTASLLSRLRPSKIILVASHQANTGLAYTSGYSIKNESLVQYSANSIIMDQGYPSN